MFGSCGGRNFGFIHGTHGPVAFANILRLGDFEIIKRPENWQPAVRIWRGKAGEVSRIDNEDGVKFKTHGTRLNISHASQEKGGEDFAIGQTAMDAGSDFFEQTVARRVFEEADERLDVGVELDGFGIEFGFLC